MSVKYWSEREESITSSRASKRTRWIIAGIPWKHRAAEPPPSQEASPTGRIGEESQGTSSCWGNAHLCGRKSGHRDLKKAWTKLGSLVSSSSGFPNCCKSPEGCGPLPARSLKNNARRFRLNFNGKILAWSPTFRLVLLSAKKTNAYTH